MRFLPLALALLPCVLAYAARNATSDGSQGCPFSRRAMHEETTRSAFLDSRQPIDVTGEHAWQKPTVGQFRGPCPGLNSLANHGYLDRSGVTTLLEATEATKRVFNMGRDLALFLSVIAVVFDGDPLTTKWSIGGAPPANILSGLGILGRPQGLSGSHNKYESDGSSGRGDAYLHDGDSSTLNRENFMAMYNLVDDPDTGNYDFEVIRKHRQYTFEYSINNNPHFFNGPFSGVIVSQAAHTFIPAFMSNHTEDGAQLNGNVLRSFFGVDEDLEVRPGEERIPDNWYRRPDPHTIPGFALQAVNLQLGEPRLLSIGGNTGKVNTFTPVDLGDLTGGVFNAGTLLEGNNLICFAYQVVQSVTPDIVGGVLGDVVQALAFLTNHLTPIFEGYGCPQLSKFDSSLFGVYPGAKGL